MLIIFDLDDTLIETSKAVTPFKFRECLKKLPLRNEEAAYAELLAIYEKTPRSKEALCAFLARHNFSPSFSQKALDELTAPLPSNFLVPTTPYAKEMLEFLHLSHTLALVTIGTAAFQREKLEKAGIDSSIFSKIEILKGSEKGPFYEAIVKDFFHPPHEVWVCGDRIEIDLAPAHELGFQTIHLCREQMRFEPWVDHSIGSLKELKGILG